MARKIGVELEMCGGYAAHENHPAGWEAGEDGSVTCPDGLANYEFRSPATSDPTEIILGLRELKKTTRLEVNRTCGTHIHISDNDGLVLNIVSSILATEDFAYALGGSRGMRRMRESSYAPATKRNPANIFRKYSSVNVYNMRYGSLRVGGVYGWRLEVRAFPGTANPSRLTLYIAYTLGIVDLADLIAANYSKPSGVPFLHQAFATPESTVRETVRILGWNNFPRSDSPTGFWYDIDNPPDGLPDRRLLAKWLYIGVKNFFSDDMMASDILGYRWEEENNAQQ